MFQIYVVLYDIRIFDRFCVFFRYSSRLVYCRFIVVMLMVGYILGFGDRYGENIFFDFLIGECVYVDFNCFFNKVCDVIYFS